MTTKHISLAGDFSKFPGGRFEKDGPFSGEEFREKILRPAFSSADDVEVVLDGVAGLPASFLEEAFAGLIRVNGLAASELRSRLVIKASPTLDRYQVLIWQYIEEAARRAHLN